MPSASMPAKAQAAPFELASTAFAAGGIPSLYTCDGRDITPPLECSSPPDDAVSFALMATDPDAPRGTWVHWVIYNVSGASRALAEAIASDAERPDGSRQGQNSWGRLGYGGPCPPGATQSYVFTLYALDTIVDVRAGVGSEELLEAIEGHILAQAQTTGTYIRQQPAFSVAQSVGLRTLT